MQRKMIQINLLPWREQARKAKAVQFVITLCICIACTLFLIGILHLYFSSKISFQDQRNAYLQEQLLKEQTVLTQLDKRRKEQSLLDSELQFIFFLRDTSLRAVRLLNELPQITPDTIVINKITRTGKQITLIGKAESNLQVTLFMKNLDKSSIFMQPVLTEINAGENSTGDERYFQLRVDQRD